jgi:adenosylcobinamide-phosphate synthase
MKIWIAVLPLLAGFLLDLLLGDPYRLPHPVRLIGRGIAGLERILRKRLPGRERMAGILLAAVILVLSTAIPSLVLFLCYRICVWLGVAVESVFCYYLLAARCLAKESSKVYRAAVAGDVEGARRAVSMIVGRDTAPLDMQGIVKAAVETVAENTSDGVTAPMFYIMLLGAGGGFFYKAANTMDSMIGYKNEKYLDFGRFAAKLDDVLNFIPSRFTALLMIFSAWLLRYDGRNAYKIWRRDRFNHASPNSAQTEAVCAGALDVMLAGDAYYFGQLCKKKTIGDDIGPIEPNDIRCANRLMYCTSVLMLAIAAAFRVIVYGILL